MVTLTTDNRFVADRDCESQEIVDSLANETTSQIWFVEARTAIGKSFLTKKVIEKCNAQYPSIETIVVKTAPSNDGRSISDGGYFSEIFEAVSYHFNDSNDVSFSTFLESKNAQKTDSVLLGESINVISEEHEPSVIAKRLFAALAKDAFGVGEYERIPSNLDAASYGSDLQRLYLESVLRQVRVLLCVDNMQNIDDKSERMLRNLIGAVKSSPNTFLFEYTVGEWGNASKQVDYFEASGAKISRLPLPNLPESHLMEAVKSNCDGLSDSFSFSIDLARYYHDVANGNLREVMDYAVSYESHREGADAGRVGNATVSRLDGLSDVEKLIVGLIAVSKGKIRKAHMDGALRMAAVDAGSSLRSLCEKSIVVDAGDSWLISHASIIDAWASEDRFAFLSNEATRWLVAFYERELGFDSGQTIVGADEHWIPLLTLYAASYPSRIENLFGYVRNGAARVLAPRDIWAFFSRFIKCTEDNPTVHYRQYEAIVALCFQCELYEEGFGVICKLEGLTDPPAHDWAILNKSMFLSALDRHDENIALFDSVIGDRPFTSAFDVNMALISLASYRSLGKLSECRQVARRINDAREIKGSYEQGIFLRLADVYNPQSRRKALRMVKRSVKIFESIGDHHQKAKSLISASYLAAQMGRPKWALKKLTQAEELLSDLHIGRHMILVNKAAANLLAGQSDERVWSMLDSAEGYAVVPFDRLAIILNKLAWCIINGDSSKLGILEADTLSLADAEPDKHVVCLVFYNLSLLFKQHGDIAKATHYEKRSLELVEYCAPMRARLGLIPKSGFRYLLKRKWAVGGLAFWTYDLPGNISSS